jgi:hypothetical protein
VLRAVGRVGRLDSGLCELVLKLSRAETFAVLDAEKSVRRANRLWAQGNFELEWNNVDMQCTASFLSNRSWRVTGELARPVKAAAT